MESVGFKEWALICEALGRGEQSIILRKGGIAEGRDGFAFKHREFFLFPTFFHEQAEKLRGPAREIPAENEGQIEIGFFARLESSFLLTDWETAVSLEPFHLWRTEVVRERFDYDSPPGLHLGIVRVYSLRPRWRFADSPRYGGCRSWVKLPDLPGEVEREPVLTDAEHAGRVGEITSMFDGTRVAHLSS
jgi:hypothetical protein